MVQLCFIVYLMGIICFFSLCTSGILCEDLYRHPSCTFNRLCTCLRPAPDMGTVTCINVPMIIMPNFNYSIISELRLENNGLRLLNERNFVRTGMQNLKLRNNYITSIGKDTFVGLEKTLMHVDLANNRFYSIPSQAIRILSKMKYLDLSGNLIHQVSKDDFQGMERSLKNLLLRDNYFTEIAQDVFANLNALESLDLSGNRLVFFDISFHNPPPQLKHLDLSDNLFNTLPYLTLQNLKSLRKLNLARNYITTESLHEISSILHQFSLTSNNNGLTIEELILDENYIEILPPRAFQYFLRIDRLSMTGNSMTKIADEAFFGTQIREIYLNRADLKELSLTCFASLSNHLQLLDLSHNSLNERGIGAALDNMTVLANVSLTGNEISQFPENAFSNSNQSLQHLQLDFACRLNNCRSGTKDEDLQELQNLRSLGLSKFPKATLTGSEFRDASSNLEKLTLRWSNLLHLSAEAFRHTPNIKILDLSFNNLEEIDERTFHVMAYSLEYLDLSKALSKSVKQLPEKIFGSLSKLKELNLSNNRLKIIQKSLFLSLTELIFLNLQDNAIENYEVDTIHKNQHNKLEKLKLSFNHITQLNPNSFTGLQNLRYLYLDDNMINTISNGAFSDLEVLQHLDLQGNHIETIFPEAFDNIPRLASLNLAHNSLKYFPLNIFNQVGSVSFLKVNMSYNRIERLTANTTDSPYPYIKVFDLSHNNISDIEQNYFQPLERLLEELYVSYNTLNRVNKSMFGDMMQLATLKLDYNCIAEMNSDSFESFSSLKVLILHHNLIDAIPQELFSVTTQLQFLDISHNSLEALPDDLFHKTRELQHLNLASNRLTQFPSATLAPLASSLNYLDLSHNSISHLSNDAMPHLIWLDLSFNDFKVIGEGLLLTKWAPRLQFLDVSNNLIGEAVNAFYDATNGHELLHINLSNTSLSQVPNFNLPNLKHLDLSKNNITDIPSRSFVKMTAIRELDLSFNNLSKVPSSEIWKTVSRLRTLNLAHNPINILHNESFTGLTNMDDLNIQGITLDKLHSAILTPLKILQTLRINVHGNSAFGSFDLVAALSPIVSLKSLHLLADEAQDRLKISNFILQSNGAHQLPPKLTDLTISGRGFHQFGKGALKHFQNRHLHLKLENVSTDSLSSETFQSMTSVRFLQMDLSGNVFQTLPDPNTAELPGGRGLFLEKMQMKGIHWKCDCGIGWIEQWARNFRHIMCQDNGTPNIYQKCQEAMENLRFTMCHNRGNKTLSEVLKHDIECEAKSSSFSASLKPTLDLAILMLTFHVILSRF